MRLSNRLRKLEAAAPRCSPGIHYLVPEGHVPSEADRCRRCVGCHVLVIEEVIVETHEEAERWRRENQSRGET